MARITPDGVIRVFLVDEIAELDAPTEEEIALGDEITNFITPTGLDTPEEGTDADASDLGAVRDKSVPATIGGDMTVELYRDDGAGTSSDEAWEATPRLKITNLVVFRFGLTDPDAEMPEDGDVCEITPVRISQRSNNRLVRGETMRFTVRFAVSGDTVDAIVGGGS